MKGKVYTRKGDEGTTGTLGGLCVGKDDAVITANGKIDSLQASLDYARFACKNEKLQKQIDSVQEKLWQTGGEVSFGRAGGPVKKPVEEDDVTKLEEWIDGLAEGREFTRFVRFTKAKAMAFNEARVRCREAEAALFTLLKQKKIRPVAFKFFNRLSDFLYVAACCCENGNKKTR